MRVQSQVATCLSSWCRQWRLLVLLALWAGLITVAAPTWQATLGFDALAFVKRIYWRGRTALLLRWFARGDPVLETQMDVPHQGQIIWGNLNGHAYKAVLFLGRVSPCVLRSLPSYHVFQQGLKGKLQVVVVCADEKKNVLPLVDMAYGRDFVWVSDPSRKLAKSWNAYFQGRLYLVDHEWRLRYIQSHAESGQQALIQATQIVLAEAQR